MKICLYQKNNKTEKIVCTKEVQISNFFIANESYITITHKETNVVEYLTLKDYVCFSIWEK